jgi:uncharacterized protein YndB with AHSA1/START domain
MPASDAKPSKDPGQAKNELVITRVFDAPRKLVFEVWTDRAHVVQWWGPHGFKTTVYEMDVRPGGRWYYSMRGPDGNDYAFDGVFLEVTEPERLVFEGAIHGDASQKVWTEVIFAEEGDKTKITVHQVFSFESAATQGAPIGWNQQLDRLVAYLAKR